jgi:cytochrome c oxidase accessory protein FixG
VPAIEAEEDESPFFADRIRVYPKAVRGPVRRFKWAVLGLCLGVYYLLPWLRWDRGPGRPDQAFLMDMWHERLYLLGFEFWPQEVYFLTGVLILGAVGLFLVTSLFGRVWCGYACPQTVWTDLFMWAERRIEGDRNARIKRDRQGMSLGKLWRKSLKHGVWLLIAAATGGAWITYYVDAPTVIREFASGTASIEVYFFFGLFTATTYLLAGLAREQVCTYMCPWPRFQSAMFDEHTITVTYQAWRGEPRGKPGASTGDCVDCGQCVMVCPTGIDIRDGAQLECIGCGLCIDACNRVMAKLDRPRWLIGWDSLARQRERAVNRPAVWRPVRPRTLIYLGLVAVVGTVMTAALVLRPHLGLSVQRDRAPLFVRLKDGDIRNAYTIKLTNKAPAPRRFELRLEGLDGAGMTVSESGEEPARTLALMADADTVTTYRVLVSAPPGGASTPIDFILTDPQTGEAAPERSLFLGPDQR